MVCSLSASIYNDMSSMVSCVLLWALTLLMRSAFTCMMLFLPASVQDVLSTCLGLMLSFATTGSSGGCILKCVPQPKLDTLIQRIYIRM